MVLCVFQGVGSERESTQHQAGGWHAFIELCLSGGVKVIIMEDPHMGAHYYGGPIVLHIKRPSPPA